MDKLAFGKQLQEARLKKSMTSKELAEIINIEDKSIWQIESGNRATSINGLVQICNALNISPEYLLKKDLNKDLKNIDSEYDELFQMILQLTPGERKRIRDITELTLRNRDHYK